MEMRDWLSRVAARNGAAPSSHKHYHGFAAKIRADFPRFALTEATAHAVGGMLGGQFPTWPELARAVQSVLSEAESGEPVEADETMRLAWREFYLRRVKESPAKRSHLHSLLRQVCPEALRDIDPTPAREEDDAFDRAFWSERGGRKTYNPQDFIAARITSIHKAPRAASEAA